MEKVQYWNRIFKAYVLRRTSQLSFWHGEPQINPNISKESIGQYYMSFHKKADYGGHFDADGIPMLDYQGNIGLQYNPIAIAQWGLGNYNVWCDSKSDLNFEKFIKCANWLVDNLEQNNEGEKVWMHHFDWEYRDKLLSPWYSGLAQGQGISVLVRAYKETGQEKYKKSAEDAFQVFTLGINDGGVNYLDKNGNNWIEEYIVYPPTHILNGFIWSLWGIYDYALQFKNSKSKNLFNNYVETLLSELDSYDTGYWSLYEHSGTFLKMIASSFYHKLHIVQLKIMYTLTKEKTFDDKAKKWEKYLNNYLYRKLALMHKIIFKLFYY